MKAFVVNPDIFISVIVQRPDSVNSLFTVRGVVRSTPFDGPIELFLVPANAPQMVYQRRGLYYPVWGIVYCCYSETASRFFRSLYE